MRDDVLRPI